VGESAVGVVYKAEDERLERVVALKVIRAFDSVSSRRRFWQEARVAAQVVHPNACRIYDFGIAKLVTLNASNDAGATLADGTMPGTFLATPRYASPQQFQGQPVDARSDLFSLGVILLEMLTGQPPFPGKSVGETRAPWADR
jgi:eukaryotic-like serine/threonine-protein kinase